MMVSKVGLEQIAVGFGRRGLSDCLRYLRADDGTLGRSLRLAARADSHRDLVVDVHGAHRLHLAKFNWEPLPGVVLNGFMLLLLVRFLFGAGEAGALPNAARVISGWFPPGSVVRLAGAHGSTCSITRRGNGPREAAYFINSPYIGWRWAFVIFGSLGLVWIWFFARWFHDDPTTHPHVNDAERTIHHGRSATLWHRWSGYRSHVQLPWRLVITNLKAVWLLGIANACTSFFSYMLFLWFPTYLKEGRGDWTRLLLAG